MIINNFINVEKMSTDELYKKIDELNARISKAHMYGMNPTIIEQLRSYIELYRNTINERAFVETFEKNRAILEEPIESDKVREKSEQLTEKSRKRVQT